jgi:hypothetical protein
LFWVSPGIGAEDFTVNANSTRVCPVFPNKDPNAKPSIVSNIPPLFDNRNLGAFKVTAYNLGPKSQEIADKEAREYAEKAAAEKAASNKAPAGKPAVKTRPSSR